jgi:thioredoxin reductase (NADPH)
MVSKVKFSDLVIVGAGPAGLSAAMNAASEGLSVTVVEAEDKVGGQAKHSSRIENYLGFPNGLTGPQLMSRAYSQAHRFGAEFVTGVNAVGLSVEGHYRAISLSNNEKVITKAVLLANGLQWKKLEAPGVEEYEQKGVFYGLNMEKAHEFQDKKVVVVGGANSAGQAAVWLSQFAEKVTMLVRGSSLSETMSTYLSERILKSKNIQVMTNTQLTSAKGDGTALKSVTVLSTPPPEEMKVDGLFIFIGATPRTAWLNEACELDDRGFVKTTDFQTTCSGVFAAGDIRSGSVKRIAASAGDGSAVVPRIHAYIATLGV